MHQSPSDVMKFSLALSPQSIAASGSANGVVLDMQGWDGVLFYLMLGVIDGTQDMQIESDDVVGFGGAANIAGAAIAQIAAAGDDTIAGVDVWRPTERFVRCVVSNGAGAVADFQGVIAVRYRATGRLPFTLDADEPLAVVKVASN